MELVAGISKARYDIFRWRYELTVPKKIVLALGVACLVGLLAQVRFYIPWSPVPITGQTFAVLLAGVVMGKRWGGISLAIYALLGIAGVPWFSPQAGMAIFSAGGINHLVGPTGGYIIGFILAALFLGFFTDRYLRARGFFNMLGLMLFANFALIYIPGLIWLGIWLNMVSGTSTTIPAIITIGATPFIVGDILKVVAAATVAKSITPKEDYSK
ncbi:MAG: biotin transporter BioY [Dehalococcoidia bacterium]|nr:MAG: biotin transporter BioY [Dehalococcoidia bacterium]